MTGVGIARPGDRLGDVPFDDILVGMYVVNRFNGYYGRITTLGQPRSDAIRFDWLMDDRSVRSDWEFHRDTCNIEVISVDEGRKRFPPDARSPWITLKKLLKRR